LRHFFFFSDATIAKYKSLLFVCYKEYLEVNPVLLGGAGIIVAVDEGVLSRRGIIRILPVLMTLEIQYEF